MNPSAIVKPCFNINNEKTLQEGNCYCAYDAKILNNFSVKMLTSEFWQQQNAITGTAQGRGTTYFIATNNNHLVLRHYYRGGLMARINRDSYWFNRFEKTRAAREYSLLKTLASLNLPAPQPVAYRVLKKGCIYQADILSSRIMNAQDLVAILQKKPLTSDIWQSIGRTIKQFHQHGIYHHDLNSHNILLDTNNKAWLIDFDRGEQRIVAKQWQENNMQRLLRSFKKERAKLATFHWHEENCQQLLSGYQ